MKPAAVWIIFIAALMGEQWIIEGSEMETVTGFELQEDKLAAVLPAAIEDQEAVVADQKSWADVLRRQVKEHEAEDDPYPSLKDLHERGLRKQEILHWQALRVLHLLKALQQRENDDQWQRERDTFGGVS